MSWWSAAVLANCIKLSCNRHRTEKEAPGNEAMRTALRAFEDRTGSYLPRTRIRPSCRADGLLDRPRLLRHLDYILQVPATLLHASAGYGKTSLLAQWFCALQERELFAAWLTLDERSRNPRTFLGEIITALCEVGFEHDPPILQWLQGGGRCDEHAVAQRLADRHESSGRPIVLFLDDVQHLSDSAAMPCLQTLINTASSGFKVIMASRGEPPIARLKWLSVGRLHEIDERELAFTVTEIVSFYARLRGMALTEVEAGEIEQRTGGWACGLALLASDAPASRCSRETAALAGSENRRIHDYLSEQCWSTQEREIREFLLRAALPSRFCVSLCDAMQGGSESARLLQYCRSHGLFVIADSEVGWFRFHVQFQAFLRAQALILPAGELQEAHRRASAWLAKSGHPLDACVHAMSAGDVDHAAKLLDESCESLFGSWRLPKVPELAARLPETVRIRHPRLMLAAACQLTVEWRFDEAEALLTATRGRLRELADSDEARPRELHFLRGVLLHREAILAQFREQPHVVEQLCEQLVREHHDLPSYLKGRIYSVRMNARRLQFDLTDFDRLDALSRQYNRRSDTPVVSLIHESIAALVLHMAGRTGMAMARLRRAVESATRFEGRGGEFGALAALPLAEIHFSRNELQAAQSLIDEYLPAANSPGLGDKLVSGCLIDARLKQHSLGDAAAVSALEEAAVVANQRGFRRMQFMIAAERIKILMQTGCRRDAEVVTQGLNLPHDPARLAPVKGATATEEAQALVWTRLSLGQGKISDALKLARQWRSYLATCGALANLVQWETLLTRLLLLDGQTQAATRALRGALSAAYPGRLVRIFMDEGPAVAALVAQYSQRESGTWDAVDAFAAEAAAVLPQSGLSGVPSASAAPVACLAGALSPTETKVLAMAGAGLRNRDVGERLGMTEGSIKWCLQQIYDKIGVRKRSQAVERARRLGLIS
jgi:ATP/maltotriose-dependent transcriptional regulator MalT